MTTIICETGRNPGHSHRRLHRVCDRDGWACYYCGRRLFCWTCEPRRPAEDAPATRDHVLPRSRGGNGALENLVACCQSCNQSKGSRLTGEARQRRAAQAGCHGGATGAAALRRAPKAPYESYEAAQAVCNNVNAGRERQSEISPYRCGACGEWHIKLRRHLTHSIGDSLKQWSSNGPSDRHSITAG